MVGRVDVRGDLNVHVCDTEPYPWPYDDRLVGEHLALVLAGWDDEWVSRALDVSSARANCMLLARAVRARGGRVLGVAHRGATALPLLRPGLVVTADGFDAFHGGPLDGILRRDRRTHLLVAGFGLEGPVHSTLRSANDRGYECLLVSDATAPLSTTLADAAVKTVTMSGGIFGAVGTTEAAAAALHDLPIPSNLQEI